MEIAFRHVVRYTNNGEIGIADLGRTLIARENIFQVLPFVLGRLFPDSPVDELRCEIVRLIRESPAQEEFAGRLFVNIQSTIEEYIKGAGRVTGLAILEKHSHGLSLLVILLSLLGGVYLWAQSTQADLPRLAYREAATSSCSPRVRHLECPETRSEKPWMLH